MKIEGEMKPFVPLVLERLIFLINKRSLNPNLLENVAITLGRIGYVCPDLVAVQLEQYVQNWCLVLRDMRDDSEKDSAFRFILQQYIIQNKNSLENNLFIINKYNYHRGLCKMIKINPNGVIKYFHYVCGAIASWETPKQDLQEMFYAILQAFKGSMPLSAWNEYFGTFPEHLRVILQQIYKL